MTATKTERRTWDVPAQPEGVTEVEAADGKRWKITDLPGIDAGTMRWVQQDNDEPGQYVLSWRSLVRMEGPLTEVTR